MNNLKRTSKTTKIEKFESNLHFSNALEWRNGVWDGQNAFLFLVKCYRIYCSESFQVFLKFKLFVIPLFALSLAVQANVAQEKRTPSEEAAADLNEILNDIQQMLALQMLSQQQEAAMRFDGRAKLKKARPTVKMDY